MDLQHKLSATEKKILFESIWSNPSRLSMSAMSLTGNIGDIGAMVIQLKGDASQAFYTLRFSQGAYNWFLKKNDVLDVNLTLTYSNDQYPDYLSTKLVKITELTWDMISDELFKDVSGIDIDHKHWMKAFLLDKSQHVYFSHITHSNTIEEIKT